MHRVGADIAARRVDVGEFRQVASRGIRVEVGQGHDLVGVIARVGPVEVAGVWAGAALGVEVVDPRVVGLGELLENGALGEAVLAEGGIVEAVAEGGARDQDSSIGIGVLPD
jgi:hypothetical protein